MRKWLILLCLFVLSGCLADREADLYTVYGQVKLIEENSIVLSLGRIDELPQPLHTMVWSF